MTSPFIQAIDYRSPTAAQQFTASLRDTGFAVLIHHPLCENLLQTIYREWHTFFRSESKHKYAFNSGSFDGYFSTKVSETAKGHTAPDLKEFFHIYPWGQYPAEVSDAARKYFAAATELATTLLQWVDEGTPADIRAQYSMPLSSMTSDGQLTMLRVLHYPPLHGDEPEDAMRAAAHGDINLLTLLPAATQAGLQVLGRDSEWHDIPCDSGMLIVNIGDMLDEASRGYYPSTTHRVLNPSGEAAKQSRISLPLFLHPRPEVVLSERHTAASYLHERLVELGMKK